MMSYNSATLGRMIFFRPFFHNYILKKTRTFVENDDDIAVCS